METQKFQLHLASKVVVPAEKGPDGNPKPGAKERTVQLAGMSNRVVRFRTLGLDEVNKLTDIASKLAGEDATGRQIYQLQHRHALYSMVYEVSEPTDDPNPQKGWKKTSYDGFQIPGGALSWSSLFSAKDTAVLEAEYSKWHEIPVTIVEMLSGKAIPVSSEV